MTRAEKIRSMSDEQLKDFLDRVACQGEREDWLPIGCYAGANNGTHHCDINSDLYECDGCDFEHGILDWLCSEDTI